MKIAHVTDTHIAKAGQLAYGVDTRRTFAEIISEISSWNPDFCVLTGDLLFREFDAESMEWLLSQFEKAETILFAVPGNHDDPVKLNEYLVPEKQTEKLNTVLSGRGEEGCTLVKFRDKRAYAYALCFNEKQFLFMDTSLKYIQASQLKFFSYLCSREVKMRLFFIHYPPVLTGHRFMDRKWSLKRRKPSDAFFKTAAESCPDADLFCGHYHYNYSTETDHYKMYVTPSTFMQIDPAEEKFTALSYDTAWRKIQIENDRMFTELVRHKAENIPDNQF